MSKQGDKNRDAIEAMLRYAQEQAPGQPVVFNSDYTVTPPRPAIGSSYYVGVCQVCTKPTPIVEDRTGGNGANPFRGAGSILVKCYSCGETARIAPDNVFSIRWERI